MNACKFIKIAEAFIYINFAEEEGLEYIERLAHAVQMLNLDEEAFEGFTNMFDNEIATNAMIRMIEKEQA